MKKRTLLPLLAILFLTLVGAAAAQGPTPLTTLRISLWPEYDDPRLLVIFDGVLPEANQKVRLPIPAGAVINAVAAASGGDLVNIASETSPGENGGQVLSLTPNSTAFRVEYYAPVLTNGDERAVHFELPAGFVTASSVVIEAMLPPDAGAVNADPVMAAGAAQANSPVVLQRELSIASATDAISQKISYANPTGALTAAEDARTATPAAAAALPAAAPASTTARSQNNLLPIALAVLAVLLVGAGGFGLWRSRRAAEAPEMPAVGRAASPRRRAAESRPPTAAGGDRFCRSCGASFAADDRFCRKCGARRQ